MLKEKLNDYAVGWKIRSVNKSGIHQEMIIEVKTRGELKMEMIDELSAVQGVQAVNCVVENGERVG